MNLPPLTLLRQNDTHRLINSKYSQDAASVLTLIADDDAQLQDLFHLDLATNDRFWAEHNQLPGIGAHELVFGIPNNRVINAAFTHAHPLGSRFNSPERGAWYAGFEFETSQTEIIFHKTQQYAEINRFVDTVSYDDYLADFNGAFHDISNSADFTDCLDPASYVASQSLAEELLAAMSLGLIYPGVRHHGGACIASFRPAVVANVRKHYRYSFTWTGDPVPQVKCLSNPLHP